MFGPSIRDNADCTSSQPIEGPNGPNAAHVDDVSIAPEIFADIGSDPFASYFPNWNSNTPPNVLIATSPKATEVRYNFCEEPVEVSPGGEFMRKKGRGFEMGRIAGWTVDRISEDASRE